VQRHVWPTQFIVNQCQIAERASNPGAIADLLLDGKRTLMIRKRPGSLPHIVVNEANESEDVCNVIAVVKFLGDLQGLFIGLQGFVALTAIVAGVAELDEHLERQPAARLALPERRAPGRQIREFLEQALLLLIRLEDPQLLHLGADCHPAIEITGNVFGKWPVGEAARKLITKARNDLSES